MFENKGEGWEKLERFKDESEFRQAYENPWIGPEDKPKMIYVVAGDARQAKRWAREHGIAPPHWRSVLSPVDLDGVSSGVFIRIGTFYQQENAENIDERLKILVQSGVLKEIQDE